MHMYMCSAPFGFSPFGFQNVNPAQDYRFQNVNGAEQKRQTRHAPFTFQAFYVPALPYIFRKITGTAVLVPYLGTYRYLRHHA